MLFRVAASIILAAALVAVPASATEKGDGSFRVEYQYIRTGAFDSSIGDIDIGNTDGHAFMFSADYAITDRWTLTASLPWIRKRHTGALPHDPVNDFTNYTPPDLRLIDDGNYHSDWQDLYIGASYKAIEGNNFSLSAFASYGFPTNDYAFYGHAAVGRNIWHLPVGVAANWRPLFSDFRFSGSTAYVFTEKTLGVDISHWLLYGEAGYFLTDTFSPKLFVSVKYGTQGLSFPDDFNLADLDNADFYYHDRTIKHNWVNGGVGFDWRLGEKYELSATWFTMLDPDQVNIVDRAWTVGLTRYFSNGRD